MFRRDADMPGVEVMLGDFGVAHLPDATGAVAAVTRRAEAVGTLAYMAPEQRRGEVSPARDVYASAVVLFEMFTGRTPWSRERADGGRAPRRRLPAARRDLRAAQPLADEVQDHLLRLGDPDPCEAPDDRAGARRIAAPARAHDRRRGV